MNPIIAEAIQDRRRLSFAYNGKPRIVEPQCYGIGERGTELLRAYQPQGDGHPERLFDRIQDGKPGHARSTFHQGRTKLQEERFGNEDHLRPVVRAGR
jgi:hypothetical protein